MNKKRLFFIVGTSLIVLVLFGLSILLFIQNNNEKTEQERGKSISLYYGLLTIVNVDDYPLSVVRNSLSDGVFGVTIAKYNYNKEGRYSGVIRSGSYQSTVDGNSIKRSFILDVEAEKKSWLIEVTMKDENTIAINGIQSSCLPEKDLIYGSFSCENSRFDTKTEEEIKDPVLDSLPYSTPYYSISGITGTDGKNEIAVRIMINYNSERNRKVFKQYQDEVINWIKSKGVNPDSYTITWRDFKGQIINS